GGSRLPPEVSLSHPLAMQGHTFLATGWINEIPPADGRLRLFAPVLTHNGDPLTGPVRYEIIPASHGNDLNIAGSFHLANPPVAAALPDATLSVRPRQDADRQLIARDQFSLTIEDVADSNQPLITLNLEGGMQAGHIYELMYDAQDPVLSGAGLAGIRDVVSALRHASTGEMPTQVNSAITELSLPPINATVAWGYSQSGRLLRQFLYQGFNEDLDGRQVFDGVVPLIAGAGFGMFNQRFAMPTRTNGQHENHLFPNDFFPFTYGDSTDPFSGRTDGILKKARESGTEPKLMHIQTSNEYWLRGGSLPHTDPLGRSDAEIPNNVRFYTIGGSPHSSGTGTPGPASSGQLPANPNLWTPIAESLLSAMLDWVNEGKTPPGSVYPKISNGTLVSSHLNQAGNGSGEINPAVWRAIPGIQHPRTMYQVIHTDFGENFLSHGIVALRDF
ncbi:MAG: alpha/beta hydrolase domain-containing protein, partial [Pseudohongiella sp.]|nr:alpha/beta hydrolase domain-containing protein [Pseudohongiella sp.]